MDSNELILPNWSVADASRAISAVVEFAFEATDSSSFKPPHTQYLQLSAPTDDPETYEELVALLEHLGGSKRLSLTSAHRLLTSRCKLTAAERLSQAKATYFTILLRGMRNANFYNHDGSEARLIDGLSSRVPLCDLFNRRVVPAWGIVEDDASFHINDFHTYDGAFFVLTPPAVQFRVMPSIVDAQEARVRQGRKRRRQSDKHSKTRVVRQVVQRWSGRHSHSGEKHKLMTHLVKCCHAVFASQTLHSVCHSIANEIEALMQLSRSHQVTELVIITPFVPQDTGDDPVSSALRVLTSSCTDHRITGSAVIKQLEHTTATLAAKTEELEMALLQHLGRSTESTKGQEASLHLCQWNTGFHSMLDELTTLHCAAVLAELVYNSAAYIAHTAPDEFRMLGTHVHTMWTHARGMHDEATRSARIGAEKVRQWRHALHKLVTTHRGTLFLCRMLTAALDHMKAERKAHGDHNEYDSDHRSGACWRNPLLHFCQGVQSRWDTHAQEMQAMDPAARLQRQRQGSDGGGADVMRDDEEEEDEVLSTGSRSEEQFAEHDDDSGALEAEARRPVGGLDIPDAVLWRATQADQMRAQSASSFINRVPGRDIVHNRQLEKRACEELVSMFWYEQVASFELAAIQSTEKTVRSNRNSLQYQMAALAERVNKIVAVNERHLSTAPVSTAIAKMMTVFDGEDIPQHVPHGPAVTRMRSDVARVKQAITVAEQKSGSLMATAKNAWHSVFEHPNFVFDQVVDQQHVQLMRLLESYLNSVAAGVAASQMSNIHASSFTLGIDVEQLRHALSAVSSELDTKDALDDLGTRLDQLQAAVRQTQSVRGTPRAQEQSR